jgi:hypothetical protein
MSCSLHKIHRPVNKTTEQHHIIPQAWQASYLPPSVQSDIPARRALAAANGLWDDRTVELCPTSHRNVHYWIVKLMQSAHNEGSDDPLVAKKSLVGNRRLDREQSIAYDALTRFRQVGGSLLALAKQGEWGQA